MRESNSTKNTKFAENSPFLGEVNRPVAIVDVGLLEESKSRYLSYALSVVSGRALPDVRDGLKPVQRRIIYAMYQNLHLLPERNHRKSAAVVGEVLARYHPHGDVACYEALVRMAQNFSLRYPLVDGQGNFGSLDGDSAAAYRYTEARLTPIALELVEELGKETVATRANFDQTTEEPVVLPTRIPQLLMNGASGIAVGLATSIPPHNLSEIVKALLMLVEDRETSLKKLLTVVKGPDFPTACQVHNSAKELEDIYATGRGAIRMRADFKIEQGARGKNYIVISSVPFAIDKSVLVERIADLIIQRKVPQLVDVRDESTDVVRIVLELAPAANAEQAMNYLFKHTALQSNFNVNLTALVPTQNPLIGRPTLLNLREMLLEFIAFRREVLQQALLFEKKKLEERVHLLKGLARVIDYIREVIEIVRRSDGRGEAAKNLQQKFRLSEVQALFIVDLRIYQLSRTSVEEVSKELAEKEKRLAEIDKILKSEKLLLKLIADDLNRVSEQYGDKRRSLIIHEYSEPELDHEEFIEQEDVYVVVTQDGWLKRLKQTNDPANTRLRDGDAISFVRAASTRDLLAIFTTIGNVFVTKVASLAATTGFGEPVQKLFRFQDGEQIVSCELVRTNGETAKNPEELFLLSRHGLGLRLPYGVLSETKRIGKKLVKLNKDDQLAVACRVERPLILVVSEQGYGLCFIKDEVPMLGGAGKGVIVQRVGKGDAVSLAVSVEKQSKLRVRLQGKGENKIDVSALTIGSRGKRGERLLRRGIPVLGLNED